MLSDPAAYCWPDTCTKQFWAGTQRRGFQSTHLTPAFYRCGDQGLERSWPPGANLHLGLAGWPTWRVLEVLGGLESWRGGPQGILNMCRVDLHQRGEREAESLAGVAGGQQAENRKRVAQSHRKERKKCKQ